MIDRYLVSVFLPLIFARTILRREDRSDLMRVCILDADTNRCIYFKDGKYCEAKETSCGMMSKDEEHSKQKYVRQPRWYEKYYRK